MEPVILHQDRDIIVCIKPPELLSENTANGTGLADLLSAQNKSYIGVVHRLDRGVGGVMVYAKTPSAAAFLSTAVQSHALKKEYIAIVHGTPKEPNGTLRDLLFHDRIKNKTFVADRPRKGVKEAILDYEVLNTCQSPVYGTASKLRIQLHTGRTHQIRVQFSSRGNPLLGDRKYGSGAHCPIALCSHRLSFPHPNGSGEMSFSCEADGFLPPL